MSPFKTVCLLVNHNIKLTARFAFLFSFLTKNLQEQLKNMSQEREELVMKVDLVENQLKAAAVEKAASDKEFSDTKEELRSVMSQLSELKENLQVEQKEKEVSGIIGMSSVTLKKGTVYHGLWMGWARFPPLSPKRHSSWRRQECIWGMSVGSFFETAAGNQAYEWDDSCKGTSDELGNAIQGTEHVGWCT